MRVLVAFGAVLVVIVVGFFAFFALLPEGGGGPDCETVRLPDAAAFTALDPEAQQSQVRDLNGCKRLVGLTAQELEAALGPPAKTYDNALEYAFDVNGTYTGGEPYPPDTTAFLLGDDGRVSDFESKDQRDPSAR